jgi:hypothetical protein
MLPKYRFSLFAPICPSSFVHLDGYVYGGKAAGVELRLQEDDIYTITVKWNEGEETFKMMNMD